MYDLIRVVDLEVWSRIGVPDEERAEPQRLLIDLELRVKDIGPASMTDNLKLTIDYAAVVDRVRMITEARPRRLVETLAEELAADLLKVFPLISLFVEIRKFILPNTGYVAVSIERPKSGRTQALTRPAHATALRLARDSGPLLG